jgi:hypothetical protein
MDDGDAMGRGGRSADALGHEEDDAVDGPAARGDHTMRSDIAGWLTLIEAEYREMPGLRLTEPQMQRLWGLDDVTCAAVIDALVARHVIVKSPQNAYIRAGVAV